MTASATVDAATPALVPMRWWHIETAVMLERELFAATAWSPAQFWSELSRGNRRYYALVAGDRIVGYAGVALNPPEADVQTVAVGPQVQGRGWGARLLDRLVGDASDAGCSEILLEVAADNAAALALYGKRGFKGIAKRTGYYGPGRDAIIMRCRLTGASP